MSPRLTNLRVHMKTLKNGHIYWLIPASRSLRDLQCCLNLSPNHFWGTWGSSGSRRLLFCSVTSPDHRALREARGHPSRSLWERSLASLSSVLSPGTLSLQNIHGVQRPCSLPRPPYGLLSREYKPSLSSHAF